MGCGVGGRGISTVLGCCFSDSVSVSISGVSAGVRNDLGSDTAVEVGYLSMCIVHRQFKDVPRKIMVG